MEYRRAVAAYAVACGLAGFPLQGFGVAAAVATVKSVGLETDDVVDDIRIDFTSGWRSMVQAKRNLQKGVQFESAVRQWVEAARAGLDADRDRLVIVAGKLSQSMLTLQTVLDMYTTDEPGALSEEQDKELKYLDAYLTELDTEQRRILLRCASIHQLDVEEERFVHSREGLLLLERIVHPDSAPSSWTALVRIAGRAARLRGGFDLASWLGELRSEGVVINAHESSKAAELERTHIAGGRYLQAIRRRGASIDLRGLGAELPPIPIGEVDADVEVLLDASDSRSAAKLLWAFLRRGRMILTGLPGGGKSTALAVLAGELTTLEESPWPILVSLKGVDAPPRDRSFRDRLLSAAVRDVPEFERQIVRGELERRLDRGEVSLLLDGLDETYDRRGQVVAELDEFLKEGPENIEVLLATREVAYGHAATLGWPALQLAAPDDLDRTIDGVLRAAAEHRFGAAAANATWTADRRRWVDAAMAADRTIRETPLLPILLTLLAVERSDSSLPSGRARILSAIVDDVVERRESRRSEQFAVGALEGRAAADAVLHAFEIEGSEILRSGESCRLDELIRVASEEFASAWGLAPGYARITAEAAVHFWDETGIFVISGAEETVAPRLMLFAEIAAARAAVKHSPTELGRWVSETADALMVEPLILAAGLAPNAAQALARRAVEIGDRKLLHAVARALREGAQLSQGDIAPVVAAILGDIRPGDREAWESWTLLADMESQAVKFDPLEGALAVFPPDQQTVGRALLDLRFKRSSELESDPKSLLDVLIVTRLERLSRREQPDRPEGIWIGVDDSLIRAVEGAAGVLLGVNASALELVIAYLGHGTVGSRERLIELLNSRGFTEQVGVIRAAEFAQIAGSMNWLLNYDSTRHVRVLEMLAEKPKARLDPTQLRRLDELADFVETLDLNDASSWLGPRGQRRNWDTLGLFMTLGGFDEQVIAAESQVVLDRLARSEGGGAFYALFDLASAVEDMHWDAIEDRSSAVDQLLEMFTWGRGCAFAAARALWGAPVADICAPLLRSLIPRLVSSTDHERIAAQTLCSIVHDPEPNCWIGGDDPILRAVAAMTCVPTREGRLTPEILQLLRDGDGNVRAAAIRRVSSVEATDRDEVLREIADGPNPGWMCLSCRTANEAGLSSCRKSGCSRAAPWPAADARAVLEGRVPA